MKLFQITGNLGLSRQNVVRIHQNGIHSVVNFNRRDQKRRFVRSLV